MLPKRSGLSGNAIQVITLDRHQLLALDIDTIIQERNREQTKNGPAPGDFAKCLSKSTRVLTKNSEGGSMEFLRQCQENGGYPLDRIENREEAEENLSFTRPETQSENG